MNILITVSLLIAGAYAAPVGQLSVFEEVGNSLIGPEKYEQLFETVAQYIFFDETIGEISFYLMTSDDVATAHQEISAQPEIKDLRKFVKENFGNTPTEIFLEDGPAEIDGVLSGLMATLHERVITFDEFKEAFEEKVQEDNKVGQLLQRLQGLKDLYNRLGKNEAVMKAVRHVLEIDTGLLDVDSALKRLMGW